MQCHKKYIFVIMTNYCVNYILWFKKEGFIFQGRSHIFKIHARSMSVEKDIRYELLARLCPNSTGIIYIHRALNDVIFTDT
jgi:hypothetical protein